MKVSKDRKKEGSKDRRIEGKKEGRKETMTEIDEVGQDEMMEQTEKGDRERMETPSCLMTGSCSFFLLSSIHPSVYSHVCLSLSVCLTVCHPMHPGLLPQKHTEKECSP